MSIVISIKERIERLDVSIASVIPGIGKIYRWDPRGVVDPTTGKNVDANGARLSLQHLDVMIVTDDEAAEEGGQGDEYALTQKTLPVEIHLKLVMDEQNPQLVGLLQNFWLYLLESTFMSNPEMTETSGRQQRLAIDSRVTATGAMPIANGQREVSVILRVEHTYQHYRSDPSTAPGVDQMTE